MRQAITTSENMRQAVPPIGAFAAYRLRLRRRGLLWRSFRSRRQLTGVVDRTAQINPGQILCFTTLRNESLRLPWFLKHHRHLGVDHFLMVDNGSDDGSVEFLTDQPDVSLWKTDSSYRASRFGLDWLTWLMMRYGHGHWVLMLDADELLVYAHHETRSLGELTRWLEEQDRESFGALMLDLYPDKSLGDVTYSSDQNPLEVLGWFDAAPYRAVRQEPLGNLWVQGGARERKFFALNPRQSPTLNKIPLVRWSRKFAFVNSCHSILPRRLNFAYTGPGGTDPSGMLLHTKFLPDAKKRAATEKLRGEHFHRPEDFHDYYDAVAQGPDMWAEESHRLKDWRQLEELGLMCSAGW